MGTPEPLLFRLLRRRFSSAARRRLILQNTISPDYPVPEDLKADIATFFDSLRNLSIEDSFTPEGLERVKSAFHEFLMSQRCWNALYSFDELCREKKDKPYRADNITPNILHEIRNCAQQLGLISRGFIPMDEYGKQGGLDADMTARLRHDSIEDYGESFMSLYTGMEGNLNNLNIQEDEFRYNIQQAVYGAETANLMSRKDAKRDVFGRIEYKDNGKIKKVERYGGDTGEYFRKMRERILALLGKYADRTENVSTRAGVSAFDDGSNRKYARQTREIYGLEAHDDIAAQLWPKFEDAIRCADDMLGLNLLILEGFNMYKSNQNLNPKNADPFRLNRYLPGALIPYQDLPAIFHPVSIHLHMLEREVENDLRMRTIIDQLILPPIQKGIQDYELSPVPGIPANDNDIQKVAPVGGTGSLPGNAGRAPMVS